MLSMREEHRPDLVGDGYDSEPLWTAKQVAEYLQVSGKRVYELPIPKIHISKRRYRWRPQAVFSFVSSREDV